MEPRWRTARSTPSATLSTHAGQPTNAVFGFVKMIQQLEQVWKPTHVAVVFDGGLPQERLSVLPTYKAQREPMPDSLRGQFGAIEEFLAHSGIPVHPDRSAGGR